MNYREQRNYENLERRIFPGVGAFDIPEIKPVADFPAVELVGFNFAKSCKNPGDKGVHFFLDDYQFNRLWTMIDRYIPILKKFRCVLSPDFSMYTDFPKAIQIYNHYRKHWCAAYMQERGITVIPTISWSTPDSFEWCFDGEPVGGCVAVSSVGCLVSAESKKLFVDGYMEMVRRLHPEKIIFYGSVPGECTGNIVRIKAFREKFKEVLCDGW